MKPSDRSKKAIKNGDSPIHPNMNMTDPLTKREYMATILMAAMLPINVAGTINAVAVEAIDATDILLEELAK